MLSKKARNNNMKRKLKKILVCSFSLMMVLAFNVSMINVEENNTSIALQ